MDNQFNLDKFMGYFCFGFILLMAITTVAILQVQEAYSYVLLDLVKVFIGSLDFTLFVELHDVYKAYGSIIHLTVVTTIAVVLAYRVEASSSNEVIESGRILQDWSHKVCVSKIASDVNSHIYLHPQIGRAHV